MLDSVSVGVLKSGFGFGEAELIVYNYLLEKNRATAEIICKETKVPKGRVYDVLNNLLDNGFIEMTYSRPKMYFISDPEKSFSNALNVKERKLGALERDAMIIAKKLSSQKTRKSFETIELINDKQDFFSKVSKEILSSSTARLATRRIPSLILRDQKEENDAVRIAYKMMVTNFLERIYSGSINVKYLISKEYLEQLLHSKEKEKKEEAIKNVKELLGYKNFELRVVSAEDSADLVRCSIFDTCCFLNLDTPRAYNFLYLKIASMTDKFTKMYDELFEGAKPFQLK
jgi:sugar-specific transcriptional regulator TrmB